MQLTITSCKCSTDPQPQQSEHKGDTVLECADCDHILFRDFGGGLIA